MPFLIAHIGHTTKHDEHITWWNPDSAGYTICTTRAGRYSEDQAHEICQYRYSIAVPLEVAEALARGTPYYRKPGGMLATMYDGDSHRPVDNTAANWKHLLGQRLVCGTVRPYKPTPMSQARSRAIYLELASKSPEKQLNNEKQAEEVRK